MSKRETFTYDRPSFPYPTDAPTSNIRSEENGNEDAAFSKDSLFGESENENDYPVRKHAANSGPVPVNGEAEELDDGTSEHSSEWASSSGGLARVEDAEGSPHYKLIYPTGDEPKSRDDDEYSDDSLASQRRYYEEMQGVDTDPSAHFDLWVTEESDERGLRYVGFKPSAEQVAAFREATKGNSRKRVCIYGMVGDEKGGFEKDKTSQEEQKHADMRGNRLEEVIVDSDASVHSDPWATDLEEPQKQPKTRKQSPRTPRTRAKPKTPQQKAKSPKKKQPGRPEEQAEEDPKNPKKDPPNPPGFDYGEEFYDDDSTDDDLYEPDGTPKLGGAEERAKREARRARREQRLHRAAVIEQQRADYETHLRSRPPVPEPIVPVVEPAVEPPKKKLRTGKNKGVEDLYHADGSLKRRDGESDEDFAVRRDEHDRFRALHDNLRNNPLVPDESAPIVAPVDPVVQPPKKKQRTGKKGDDPADKIQCAYIKPAKGSKAAKQCRNFFWPTGGLFCHVKSHHA